MEFISGELRRLEELRVAKHISDAEHAELRTKVLNGTLSAPSATETDLAEHFQKEALRKHQAWRVQYEDFLLQEASYKEEDIHSKQDTFLNLAKANSINPLERMLSAYSLYGTNADAAFFKSLIANVPDEKRVEYHNWYVARGCGEAFLSQHGATIAAGAPPLFGSQKEFGPLNVALLKQTGREITGAGPKRTGCFEVSSGYEDSKVIFAAGYPVPVVDGYVDLGIVEQAVDWLDGRIKELEGAMEAAKVAVPPPARAPPNKKVPPQQYHNQGYNNQGGRGGQYNYNSYNSGYSNRGRGGRNRGGRGRGYGYQGNY